jgi:hypothetical protein
MYNCGLALLAILYGGYFAAEAHTNTNLSIATVGCDSLRFYSRVRDLRRDKFLQWMHPAPDNYPESDIIPALGRFAGAATRDG